MNLEEFVSTSLEQIVNGVKRAQETTRLKGKCSFEANLVNPAVMYSADMAPKGAYFATSDRNLVHFVSFDVAVTADSAVEGRGGISLKVAGLGFEAGGTGLTKDSVVSRIKFEVPIALPKSTGDQQ